ncbi:hypothetical protein J5226_08350 [Lysobacter sp. K5869]|uniref:hypothetical protein n=1 Tax=Lysobacter sp. K5869 TaxID=2820808 RepID=UPI001C061190|nr:hypothetical protein [Lysobacter sp. K5869]QWP78387.1 hypothetical protein J5226_08350 [Lysobacter sp. K5869]
MKYNREIPMRNCVFRISILAVLLVDCIAHLHKPEADTLDLYQLVRVLAQLGSKGGGHTVVSLQGCYGAA